MGKIAKHSNVVDARSHFNAIKVKCDERFFWADRFDMLDEEGKENVKLVMCQQLRRIAQEDYYKSKTRSKRKTE